MTSLMYLFPCALVEDFTFAELSGTITTEYKNKWSTTSAEATPSLDEITTKNNKKSLKIAYNTSTRRYITRGIDGTNYDNSSWNNPFGVANTGNHHDATWANNMGAWIYTTSHVYSDDNDLLKFGYATSDDDSVTFVNWPSNVDTTGKWIWSDVPVNMQYDTIDRFRLGVDHSGAGNLYLNSLCVLKKSTSNVDVYDSSDKGGTNSATGDFDWTNGIGIVVTNITRTLTGFNLSAYVEPKYYRQSIDQLLNMRTTGVVAHQITRGGYHKLTSIKDLGYLKTYLFYGEFVSPEDSDHYEMFAEPVVVSDISITHVSGQPHVPRLTINLVKYTGI